MISSLNNIDLVESIKKVAVNAVTSTNPTTFVFGKVESDKPLKIKVEQKITLTQEHLILTRNVTDFTVDVTVDQKTEDYTYTHTHTITDTYTGGGSASNDTFTHNHEYKGKKAFTIHNKLKTGDNVLLARMQGGQKYIVIDRVVAEI